MAFGGSAESARTQIDALGGMYGNGSPEGEVFGSPGDIYINRDGGVGQTLWVKESGIDTDTGWAAK